jgi:MOSC domain-containing protein YiiM
MRLASVNIGRPKELDVGGRTITTGIYKRPVPRPVRVGRLGLDGDAVVDGKVHGGPDQAVYVFGSEDYEWFSFGVGRSLEPGMFGDNLTIDGLASADFAVGDRLEIGDTVVIEVTAPRTPCNTLARRMGNPHFIKRFREGERPGLYCRVVAEGEVHMGDPVAYQLYAGDRVGVVELFRAHYDKQLPEATLRRFLVAPLAERTRREMQERLEKLTAAAT